MTPPQDGFDAAGRVTVLGRAIIAAFDLSILLRGAAMDGEQIAVDTVKRTDPHTLTEYTEVLVSGSTSEDDHEPGGTGTAEPPPA